jgi:methyl-accepting chemotaxis protein
MICRRRAFHVHYEYQRYSGSTRIDDAVKDLNSVNDQNGEISSTVSDAIREISQGGSEISTSVTNLNDSIVKLSDQISRIASEVRQFTV